MKLRNLFVAVMAAATVLTGCLPNKDKGPAVISVTPETLAFDQNQGEKTVTVVSNYQWVARTDADWIVVTPAEGGATDGTVVTISVTPNNATNRTEVVNFYGNNSLLCWSMVEVSQEGPEGEEGVAKPLTVAEFIEKADTKTAYQLTGRISNIANGSFYGFDLTDETGTISIAFPENFQDYVAELATGGTVTVEGNYQWYEQKKAHQMANGKITAYTAPEQEDPSKVQAVSIAEFIQKADPMTTYRLTGTITSSVNSQYCSFDMKDATGSITVWTVNNAAEYGNVLKKGYTVTLRGKYTLYGTDKHEVIDAWIESYSEGSNARPDKITDVTVAEFIAKPESTTEWYRLTGKISGSINTKYGNFDVVDETGSVYFYGADNVSDFASKLVAGNTITVVGNRGSYGDKVEVLNGYIESVTEGTVTPATPVSSMAELLGLDNKTNFEISGLQVAAITTKGYVATDGTHAVYVYEATTPSVSVGDVVSLTGTKDEYYGLPEVTGPKTTKTSTGTVSYPDPVDITANFASFSATEAVYVKYSATVEISGNYTNFVVSGVTDLKGALSSAPSFEGLNNGDQVVVYGYFNGINTSNKLLNVIAVKIDNITTSQTIEYKTASSGGGNTPGGDTPTGGSGGQIEAQSDGTSKISWSGQAAWGGIGGDVIALTAGNYTISVAQADGGTKPTVNGTYNDCRAYAKNTLTISNSAADITSISFAISTQGKKRLTDITASTGSVAVDTSNWTVTWTGSAKSVTLTVGEKATHGTEGSSKAGQFDFDYIIVKP